MRPGEVVFDAAWRERQRHQPFFCEENVWHLLQAGPAELPEPRAALFVTNEHRSVAMWGQRAAVHDPIVWDYHVVVLLPAHGLVVDLDDRARPVWPVREWIPYAFRAIEPRFAPRFRIVPAAAFLATFSSDRSHMLDAAGRPLQPLPPWPAPFVPSRGTNLQRFLDLADPFVGRIVDVRELLTMSSP